MCTWGRGVRGQWCRKAVRLSYGNKQGRKSSVHKHISAFTENVGK